MASLYWTKSQDAFNSPVLGVDLLFESPEHSDAVPYTYHAVKYPVRFMLVPDPTKSTHTLECDADWMGQLKQFLDEGWKLVDICIDNTALAEGRALNK